MAKSVMNGIEIEFGSGNVFRDLGFPDADELKIKSGLAIQITLAIRRLGLTQQEAGRQMRISQAKVSGLDARRLRESFREQAHGVSESTWIRHRDQAEAGKESSWRTQVGGGMNQISRDHPNSRGVRRDTSQVPSRQFILEMKTKLKIEVSSSCLLPSVHLY